MNRLQVVVKFRKLREIIARKNMGQNSFARAAALTSGHVSQILNGKRMPSAYVRAKVMKALGVEFDEVFSIR